MAPKKPWRDTSLSDLHTTSPLPETRDAALAYVRRLVNQYHLDRTVLFEGNDSESRGDDRLFDVTYAQIAPFIGLEPLNELRDIGTFEIHRSRIPNSMFKSIIKKLDTMVVLYGPPPHQTEQAASMFFSSVFNRLIQQFSGLFRNNLMVIARDEIDAQHCYKHSYTTFGSIVLLFMEMKLDANDNAERLEAMAQFIAEADACDRKNRARGFLLPLHCIFFDGFSYEIFKFERNPTPSFLCARFPGDQQRARGLPVLEVTADGSNLPFILHMRVTSEAIFDTFLNAYIAGLKAHYNKLKEAKKTEGVMGLSLDGWGQVCQNAERALELFRKGEDQRQGGDLDAADSSVSEGFLALNESTREVPATYKAICFMTGWDDEAIRKAD